MHNQLLLKSLRHNQADLLSFKMQLNGTRETTLSKERLAELIQTKKNNIARLKLQLNR